ncbi:MAG: tetratricopeptide repeat protein [Planctomycetota bacterium]
MATQSEGARRPVPTSLAGGLPRVIGSIALALLFSCGTSVDLSGFLDRVHESAAQNRALPEGDDLAEKALRDASAGRSLEAVLGYVAALRKEPHAPTLSGLSAVLDQMKQYELAAEAYALAAELDASFDTPERLLARADLLRKAKDFEGARALAAHYLERAEGQTARARGLLFEGLTYQDEIRLDEASARYEQALELTPEDPLIWLKIAQVLSLRGEAEPAREWLQKVLERTPKDPQVLFELGKSWLESGDAEQAAELLERAVRLDPRNRRAIFQLARAQRRLGNEKRADELTERFESLEAQANAEHASEMDQQAVGILLDKAKSELEAGNKAAARETIHQLLTIAPNNEQALALKRKVDQ